MPDRYLFFILIAVLLVLPLVAAGLNYRFRFSRYWPGLLPGLAVMLLLMVPWDVWFTAKGLWGYNDEFVCGVYLAELPIEKWLYFLVMPYAGAFIYEALNNFRPRTPATPTRGGLASVLILICFVVSVIFSERVYTFSVFSLLCLLLLWHLLINRSDYLGQFFLAFLFYQVPFVLVNGSLTGLFSNTPAVWYDRSEIIGVHILTLPVENVAYDMFMLLIVITVLEEMKLRRPTGVLTVG